MLHNKSIKVLLCCWALDVEVNVQIRALDSCRTKGRNEEMCVDTACKHDSQ